MENKKEDRLWIRIDSNMKKEIAAAAEAENRSVSNFVLNVLTQYLNQNKK